MVSKKPTTDRLITACKKIGSTKKVAKITYKCVKVKQVAMWKPVNKTVIALKK
jgi:hypothetical protein